MAEEKKEKKKPNWTKRILLTGAALGTLAVAPKCTEKPAADENLNWPDKGLIEHPQFRFRQGDFLKNAAEAIEQAGKAISGNAENLTFGRQIIKTSDDNPIGKISISEHKLEDDSLKHAIFLQLDEKGCTLSFDWEKETLKIIRANNESLSIDLKKLKSSGTLHPNIMLHIRDSEGVTLQGNLGQVFFHNSNVVIDASKTEATKLYAEISLWNSKVKVILPETLPEMEYEPGRPTLLLPQEIANYLNIYHSIHISPKTYMPTQQLDFRQKPTIEIRAAVEEENGRISDKPASYVAFQQGNITTPYFGIAEMHKKIADVFFPSRQVDPSWDFKKDILLQGKKWPTLSEKTPTK